MNLLEFTPVMIEPKGDSEVYRYISKVVGVEISEVTKPCYVPKLVKYYADLQRYTGITDDMIKTFVSGISSQYVKFNIYREKYTVLILIAILHYMRMKKIEIARTFFKLLSLKFYASRLHIHFSKFCNEDLWIMSLDKLSPKHLFKSKNGISNAIFYISDFDFDKNKNKLASNTIKDRDLVLIVYGLRTKIAQSMKSFAEIYYHTYNNRMITAKADTDEYAGTQLTADKISMTMCTFGQIDKLALKDAIIKSRIRKDLAISIISQMSVPEYKDKIRFLIILMSRLDELKNVCIDSKRNKIIRKMNSKVKIANKYLIKEEIKNLMYSLESGYQLRTIYDAQLVMFFGYYLTTFLRNRIC